eukprot:CAMPEP_0114535134 /NCGR_PEP_ID=MMETSP0109-20121206/28248_1 /TAXON_ID=29199 /ORGANISM="Chlorarachnion reptans, Strain CCCM449" /LENGTH=37 /DNA_ID= /DNA_START= /DNA_END= /DNA_ORIENTATION=
MEFLVMYFSLIDLDGEVPALQDITALQNITTGVARKG